MGIIIQACPHCCAEAVAFEVIGAKAVPRSTDEIGYHFGSAAAVCSRCDTVIAVTIVNERPAIYSAVASLMTQLVTEPHSAESIGLQIERVWPTPRKLTIPAHLIPNVERLMRQAERNYEMEGNEEAAAAMYCRALELTLKDQFPHLCGSLAAQATQLVADNVLPERMGNWAEEIRVLGDDAAREMDGVDRDQLRILRGFVKAMLRQLHTLSPEHEAR